MNPSYVKGRRFEYRVRDFFRAHGFLVIRPAQSKPVDLICLRKGVMVLVECKTDKHALRKREKQALLEMAETTSATPVLAYREKRQIKLLNLKSGTPLLRIESLLWRPPS